MSQSIRMAAMVLPRTSFLAVLCAATANVQPMAAKRKGGSSGLAAEQETANTRAQAGPNPQEDHAMKGRKSWRSKLSVRPLVAGPDWTRAAADFWAARLSPPWGPSSAI